MSVARVLKGAAIGLVAGLAASWVMERAQAALQGGAGGEGESATTRAADKVSQAVAGRAVPKPDKPKAGAAVHYGFGAALGLIYGAVAAQWRGVTAGLGAVFAIGVALVADEALVPALGLGPSPADTPPKTHAYSLASHLVFGVTLEAVRRALGRAL
jgi:putative membrane protein